MSNSLFSALDTISLKEYAPVPFWSWNNEIKPEECKRQIRQMQEVGFGGFIIHARAGLKTEYLGEEWFACVQACIDEAKKRDMCIWIYDEFGYPSGFVGGTLLENESHRAEYLEYELRSEFDESAFSVYVQRNGGYVRIEKATDADCYHTVYKRRSPCNVDILNPDMVGLFLEKTYEAYYKRFADEFGKTIRGFFTDEPQYYRYATPYTSVLEREIENVKDGLIHLFGSEESDYAFRVKYYQTMNRLYTENYYKRLYDWCEKHGCQLTGHTVEEPHLFSQMWGSAGAMPSYRYSHVAGIDHLCQAMDGVMDEVQVESVAAQFGIRQVMSESFACTGYDANFRTLKYIADHQYAQGVNYLVVHLMNYSLQGAGYKDHPQTFSSHAAWWNDFSIFNDYYTKLGYIFANTKRQVNLLLIHPMQDCYLTYDRKEDKQSVVQAETEFYTLSKELAERGIAFHYADETLLKDYGKTQDGQLLVGGKEYDYVILPNRKSINASTQELLKSFTNAGGKLCVLGAYPMYVEGEKGVQELQSTLSYEEVLHLNTPIAKCDGKVFQRHSIGELGEFLFLLNTDEKKVECSLPLGWSVVDLERKECLAHSGCIQLKLKGSVLLKRKTMGVCTCSIGNCEYKDVTNAFSVTGVDSNNLLLDFAKVSFDGKDYSESKHTEQILDELIRASYQGPLYLKYEFTANDLPKQLSILSQNNRVKGLFVNGTSVEMSATEYDPYFSTAEIIRHCKAGKNKIIFLIDFYENPNVHYAIYGENVTESLVNMMSYDTVIEPIFLQGDFCVNESFALTKFRLPNAISCIEKQGFPFYNGVVTIEGRVFSENGQPIKLRLTGNFATAEIYLNGKKSGAAALHDEVFIDGLQVGENHVEIRLKSTMRNMYGPHHCKGMQEDWGACPYMFTFFKCWQFGEPKDFTREYNFSTFGVEKIEIGD